jgi:hypothetical protein
VSARHVKLASFWQLPPSIACRREIGFVRGNDSVSAQHVKLASFGETTPPRSGIGFVRGNRTLNVRRPQIGFVLAIAPHRSLAAAKLASFGEMPSSTARAPRIAVVPQTDASIGMTIDDSVYTRDNPFKHNHLRMQKTRAIAADSSIGIPLSSGQRARRFWESAVVRGAVSRESPRCDHIANRCAHAFGSSRRGSGLVEVLSSTAARLSYTG